MRSNIAKSKAREIQLEKKKQKTRKHQKEVRKQLSKIRRKNNGK